MISLENQTLFVTGASRGAGAGIARQIAEAGGKVILGYARNTEAAKAMASELGDQAIGLVQADFSDPDAAEPAWSEAKSLADGPIHGLVLNHGVFEASNVHDPADIWRQNWARTLQINLQSCADLARCAAQDWVDSAQGGSLVAISSRAAHRGDDADHPAYAASKAGLIAMIKTLARAYSGRGLLAYAISPGWIDTEMAPQDPDDRKAALAEVPYGDMASPDELGRLCAFLLSGACKSATGATFDVNGASYVR
ncbi:MAG: SDR family oxidoreductase [Oceanicaulis sp.]|jgi:3-oxoacyl-[acyl-carrier protein] reductase|nr:SDR family oxidoreductase [Oceanicaulis sp.]